MPEEGLAEAPVVEAETTPAPDWVSVDGTLAENWTNGLDDELRDEKSLSTIKNVKDLAKSYVNTKKMVGKNKIAIPTESSADSEWAEYYRVGGRPDTVEDYGLAVPDGFPAEIAEQVFPADRIAKWQERFHKGGVSKKAAHQFVAEFANDMLSDYQAQQQAKAMAEDELVRGLSQEWGAAYDQNIHYGNMAIEEGTAGDVDFKARVVAKVQHDPDLTKLLSNIGSKFSEGKPPGYAAIPTPADYQAQITEIMENPLYLNGTKQQRDRLVAQVMAIREKMTPEPANT